MYKRRLFIFIYLCIAAFALCLARLIQLQVLHCSEYRRLMDDMKLLDPQQLPTVRGKILDRSGNILAVDRPVFYLHINYQATKLLDERFWQANILLKTDDNTDAGRAEKELREELADRVTLLRKIIGKCAEIGGIEPAEVEERICHINDRIWNLRQYVARRRRNPAGGAETKASSEPVTITDIIKTDLAEMHQSYPVMELDSRQMLLAAQLEFAALKDVEILPEAKRVYPFGSAACQLIGWVGPVQEHHRAVFADDEYLRYLENDIIGADGLEKLCESVLRGRRGQVVYDRNKNLIEHKQTEFGKDITLTIDIELQQRIEKFLSDPNYNDIYCKTGTGVVVLDVATGQLLAVVSVPVYDLNRVRQDYNKILSAEGNPLLNKCLSEHYPPGSSIKPFLLAAALEAGIAGPDEKISCPFENAPGGWPNCLLFRKGSCHDWRWEDEGGNIARNAVKGSCNVYFSRLADRFEPASLRQWLYKFGFGRGVMNGLVLPQGDETNGRTLIQPFANESEGLISARRPDGPVNSPDDIPLLPKGELRWFGIGQGNFRATVLQVANATAVIARNGLFRKLNLFLTEPDHFDRHEQAPILGSNTVRLVRDAMWAVVNEYGGSAYSAFQHSGLSEYDIKVYGKTGSAEKPDTSWFTCFAEDSFGRAIVIAIVVPGGQSGGQEAAPLAREIIRFCNIAGFIGKAHE